MIRALGILILLVFLIGMTAVSCATAAERTPPGSFLVYRASTAAELANQVTKNEIVKMRYARHFKIAPDRVASYFSDNLKLVTLKRPLKVETWYVTKTGDEIKKTKLLPKGTLVFVNKSGEPTLSWSCGNPLRAKLAMAAKAETKTAGSEQVATNDLPTPEKAAVSEGAAGSETKVLANPVEIISAAAVTVPPGMAEQAAVALAADIPVTVPPAIGAMATQAIAAAPPLTSGANYAWIGGLAGLAGVAAVAAGGGSGESRSEPQPLPEPSGLLVTAMGLIAIPVAPELMKRLRLKSRR